MNAENFTGFAPQQTTEFLATEIAPILNKNKELLGLQVELKV
jgi:adenylosuccinate lyase